MGAVAEASMSCKIYFARMLPAKASAAGCARLVDIQATRTPVCILANFGLMASACWPPPSPCGLRVGNHSPVAGSLAGGGAALPYGVPAVTGSTGGANGGGGKPLDELLLPAASACWPPLRLPPLRVKSVSVCSVCLSCSEYSQHGNTLCPEGALSS